MHGWLLDCEQLSYCPGSVCQPSPLWMWECRTCVWVSRCRVLECVCNKRACRQEDKTTLVGHQGPDVQRRTPAWFGCSHLRGDLEMIRVRFLTLCYTPSVFRWDFSPHDVKADFSWHKCCQNHFHFQFDVSGWIVNLVFPYLKTNTID